MFGFLKSITSQPRAWKTPDCNYWKLYDEMARESHLLVAGATGSGKSVVINGVISALLRKAPTQVQFILIDPKWTELGGYEHLPHTIKYACDADAIIDALQMANDIMDQRMTATKRAGKRMYEGGDIYLVIDELAEIMLSIKGAKPPLQRILQLGRALKIHCIAGTQCPLATVIPTAIKVNFTGIVGLRTATAQHSRNIIMQAGCETFPEPRFAHKAYGYFLSSGSLNLYTMPYVGDDEINALVDHWTTKKCWA